MAKKLSPKLFATIVEQIQFKQQALVPMGSEDVLHFEDLNLKFSQIIQIHPEKSANADERFDCVLVGCLKGEAVIVTAPESGIFPRIEEGHRLVIRVLTSQGIALFPTIVLFVTDTPTFLVYLDFPKAIRFKRVRQDARVEVALPVLVSNPQKKLSNVAGRISDISASGAKLNLFADAGDPGDEIEVKGKFEVGDIQRMLSIRALIRAKKTMSEGVVSYGVEFIESDEDKQLVLLGFVFNAMVLGRIQTIG